MKKGFYQRTCCRQFLLELDLTVIVAPVLVQATLKKTDDSLILKSVFIIKTGNTD